METLEPGAIRVGRVCPAPDGAVAGSGGDLQAGSMPGVTEVGGPLCAASSAVGASRSQPDRRGRTLLNLRHRLVEMDSGDGGVMPRRHRCPGLDRGQTDELTAQLRQEPWIVRALQIVHRSGLPDAWIGAGAIRDVVWGRLTGGFDPRTVHDLDVAFLDPTDLTRRRDQAAQQQLCALALDLPWEATNQAAVHTWFHHDFGGEVPPPARSAG